VEGLQQYGLFEFDKSSLNFVMYEEGHQYGCMGGGTGRDENPLTLKAILGHLGDSIGEVGILQDKPICK
jgi:hypothetical protein